MRAAHPIITLFFVLLAPVGWFMFWAVFHTAPGQDWVVFHTAAALFRAGDFQTLGDARAFTDVMNSTHVAWFVKPISVLHPWVYPPVTLLLALAFGWMAYPVSLAAFLATTIVAMVAALWRWETDLRGRLLLIGFVLLCPATAFAIGAGQLSFLVAAAVLAGLSLLDARPFWAGMLFSLLCLKPQFVPLIPVALLAGRHFRAIAGGLVGGAALVALSAAVIGVPAWVSWIRLASGTDPVLGKLIDVVRVYDQSVHTCLRILGASESIAGIGQMLAIALSALCIWIAFARPFPLRHRAIVLLCALVAGAPHVGDYDHVLVAIAVMMVLRDADPPPRGVAALAAATWLATMFNPPALIAVLGVPILTALSAMTGFLPASLMIAETMRRRAASKQKQFRILL